MASKKDFSETLYEELKCYICESRLKAGKHRWYRCTQAHLVCQDCKEVKEKKNCSCSRFIPPEHIKVIEALLDVDKMKFKCENLARGCQESSDKENMISHQVECIQRLVKCPYVSCESKVPFLELLDHMKEKEDFGLEMTINFAIKNQFSTTNGQIVTSSSVVRFYPALIVNNEATLF